MSCGVKHRGRPASGEIIGTDGKSYRGDVRATGVAFETPEVWDVMPSQMAFVPHSCAKRDRGVSSKANAVIVGTTIAKSSRPNSAFQRS
jgi:hypothetical protein